MKSRLKVGSKALATQEFRYATQGSQEAVSKYINKIRKVFRKAIWLRSHGREETWKVLHYVQLQEGLNYTLMKAPTVSGVIEFRSSMSQPGMKNNI